MNAAQFLKQASSGITGVCLALYKLSDWLYKRPRLLHNASCIALRFYVFLRLPWNNTFFPALAPEYVLTGVSTHTFSRACNRLHLTHRCHACHRGHVFCLSCDWFFEFRFNDWFKLEYQPLFGKISSRSFSLSSRRRTFLRQDGAIRSCDWFSLTVTLLFLLSVVTSWPRSS